MRKDSAALWTGLAGEVTRLMATNGTPGVAVGVLQGGEIQADGFGVTNIDHPLPVTPETLYQIGSITKTFVGTAAMRLVEMGKLDLNGTVQSYLPAFRVRDETASREATVRHLFTHTGGWEGDVFLDTGAGDDALEQYVAALADCPQIAPLGSHFSYNNAGFSVAGRIFEQCTGQTFEAALSELVLNPLGLTNVYLEPTEAMLHGFVVGHRIGVDGPTVAAPWPLSRSARPAGGIICSVTDLLRYARFHLNDGVAEDGSRLLTPVSVAQMQEPLVQVWGEEEAWGITWAVRTLDGVRLISHNGGTVGQQTMLVLVPERNFALAVLTNSDRGGHLYNALRRWILGNYLGLDDPLPTPRAASVDELTQFEGRYSRPYADLELGLLGERLIGQFVYKKGFPDNRVVPPPPPPMTFALCGPDRLMVLDGPMQNGLADVIRQPDGSIGWLRMGRLHRRLEVQ